jgi:hypothetical protein
MAGPTNTSSFIYSLLHRAMKDCSHHHPTETLSFCCIPHSALSPLLLGSDNCVRVHVPDSSAQSTIPSLILFSPFPIYLLAFALSLVVLSVVYLLSLSLSRSLLPFIRSLFLRPYLFTLHVYYFVLIHILRSLLQFMTLPVFFSRCSVAHNTSVCRIRYILYTVEVLVSISTSKQNTQSGKKHVNPESVIDAK